MGSRKRGRGHRAEHTYTVLYVEIRGREQRGMKKGSRGRGGYVARYVRMGRDSGEGADQIVVMDAEMDSVDGRSGT